MFDTISNEQLRAESHLGCASSWPHSTVFAQGGPPLLTDDPGTPGKRNWEINIASTHFRSPGEHEFEAPLLDINYGLGDRIQLKYEVPYLFDSDESAPYRSAVGNSLFGAKWRLNQAITDPVEVWPPSITGLLG